MRPDILLCDYSCVFRLALGANEFSARFTLMLFLCCCWVVLNRYVSAVNQLG